MSDLAQATEAVNQLATLFDNAGTVAGDTPLGGKLTAVGAVLGSFGSVMGVRSGAPDVHAEIAEIQGTLRRMEARIWHGIDEARTYIVQKQSLTHLEQAASNLRDHVTQMSQLLKADDTALTIFTQQITSDMRQIKDALAPDSKLNVLQDVSDHWPGAVHVLRAAEYYCALLVKGEMLMGVIGGRRKDTPWDAANWASSKIGQYITDAQNHVNDRIEACIRDTETNAVKYVNKKILPVLNRDANVESQYPLIDLAPEIRSRVKVVE